MNTVLTRTPTEDLRATVMDDWTAATTHPFVHALADGTLPREIMAGYLQQDYQFVDGFVRLLASAVAHAPTATAHDGLFRFYPSIEEGHAVHRLYGRARRIEPLQDLVAQGHALVVAQHGIFHAPDAGRKAVRIEAGHRGHAQQFAGFAVHHHDRAGFQPDAACGIVL